MHTNFEAAILMAASSLLFSVQAGAARMPPCAFALIFWGLSIPIQTPATRSAV